MSGAPQALTCAGEVRHAQDEVAGHSPGRARAARQPPQGRPLTGGVVALTTVVFALVARHGTLAGIQRLDDAWLRLMVSGRTPALTVIAKIFNVLGLVYVTLPVRIAVAGFLALRRRWWHLAAFTAAVVVSEVLIGPLKGIYDRARPPGSLVATSGASSRQGTPSPRPSLPSRRSSP
jgi:hypothetical protein